MKIGRKKIKKAERASSLENRWLDLPLLLLLLLFLFLLVFSPLFVVLFVTMTVSLIVIESFCLLLSSMKNNHQQNEVNVDDDDDDVPISSARCRHPDQIRKSLFQTYYNVRTEKERS